MAYLWNKPSILLLAGILCAAGLVFKLPLMMVFAVLLVVLALLRLPDAPTLSATEARSFVFYFALLTALAGSALAAWPQPPMTSNSTGETPLCGWHRSAWSASAALRHERGCDLPLHSRTPRDASTQPLSHLEIGFVALTTMLALALRVYDLPTLPPMVHGDEGEVGMLALRILGGEEPLPIFASTIFGHNPAGFPYLMAPLIALFGRNEVGLRLLPALFGAVSVPFLYLIGRRGWGVVAGGMAAWLLAVSHFHIHYSRIAVPNIANATIVIVLVWLLMRAYYRNVRFWAAESSPGPGETGGAPPGFFALRLHVPLVEFVAVGLVIGFGQYIYHGSRLLPMIAAMAFLVLLLKRKITLIQVLVACLAALVVIAPLGAFYAGHWEQFVGRSQDVFIFKESNLKHAMGADATFADDLLPYLRHQLVTTLGFITGDGDRSSFYLADIPAMDTVTLVLLWLGFGVILTRIRRYEESIVAAWFVLGMLFAGFLTTEQPNGPRLVSVAPACYLIAAVFVQRCWELMTAPANSRRLRPAMAAVTVLALVILFLNVRTYFVELKGYTHSILPTEVARAVAAAPDSAAVYLLGDPIVYSEHGTIRFLAGTEGIFDLRTAAELPAADAQRPGRFVLALEPSLAILQEIEEQNPGGERASYSDTHGRFLYATYYLP